MGRPGAIRWPWEPFERFLPRDVEAPCGFAFPSGTGQVAAGRRIADRLGCSPRDVWRAKREGLTDYQADRWALALGLHPALIWDDWDDPDRLYRELHAEWVVLRQSRTDRISRWCRSWEARRARETAFCAIWGDRVGVAA